MIIAGICVMRVEKILLRRGKSGAAVVVQESLLHCDSLNQEFYRTEWLTLSTFA
jgi:hypothetical protein